MKSHEHFSIGVWLLLLISFNCYFDAALARRATVTNVKCKSFNRNKYDFTECRLRLVKRNLSELFLTLKVDEKIVDNFTAHFQFMKKSNGYRPYLFDIKFDVCKFLSTKSNNGLYFIYKYMEPYMNLNHSCPIDHDLILKKVRIHPQLANAAQILPYGDYALFTTWMVNGVKITHVQFFLKYDEH